MSVPTQKQWRKTGSRRPAFGRWSFGISAVLAAATGLGRLYVGESKGTAVAGSDQRLTHEN